MQIEIVTIGNEVLSGRTVDTNFAFLARALMDTAFNVWYDQRPRNVGAMIDDLFRRLRSVVSAERGGARRRAQK